MKKSVITTGAIAAGALLAMLAPMAASATQAEQPYTIVAWTIDSNDTADQWPQTYSHSRQIGTVDLAALDATLECGTAYQVDVYDTGEQTDAVIAANHLTAPNRPLTEDHVEGAGTDYSWKVFKTAPCVAPQEAGVETVTVDANVPKCGVADLDTKTTTTTITYTFDPVANANIAGEPVEVSTYGKRPLTAEEIAGLDCYTPPVLNCGEYEAPGVLNEHGDPTACVSNHPCPGEMVDGACPVDVPEEPTEPPVAEEPVVVPEIGTPDSIEAPAKIVPAVEKTAEAPALAYTGSSSTVGAWWLLLLPIGGALMFAARKFARA